MAKTTIEIGVNTGDSAKSLSDLKGEFKELQKELSGLEQGSEQYIATLKRLGAVKDDIGDLRSEIEGFAGADKKIAAIGNVIGGVASGFAAAQGAAALFGAESESVEKALLKVQAAMALAQGIEGLIAMQDSFKVMKTVALDALKGIKTGIAATGIGLFLVALGTVVAYWDEIKEAISGVGEEQKKLLEDEQKSVQAAENKLDSISKQENILKLQGKTEREILVLKQKATDEEIKALEAQLLTQEEMKKSQVETAKRNHDILQGIIRFISAPIDILLKGVDMVGKAFGQNFELAEKFSGGLANLIFDPAETAAEADATIDETKKKLEELKNARAGYQLQINQINKTASNEAKRLAEEDAEKWRKEQQGFIDYELEALNNKYGEAEQIIAEQQLATKIALNTATPQEIEAWNAYNLQKQQEYNNAVDAELKRLKEKEDKRKADEDAKIAAEYALRLEGFKQLELQKVEWAKQGLTLISELNTLFSGQSEAQQKRAFEIDKAVKLSSATISGIEGTINAYSTAQKSPITAVFPAYPAIQAGLAAAFAAVNIAKIAKTKFGGTEKATAPSGGGNLGTFSQGGGGGQPPGGLTSQNTVTQLNPDGTVAGQGNREAAPMKAYVVESESRAVTERVNKLSNNSKIG
jgi:hypothetical protein